MSVKLITPAEAKALYGSNIPDFVFEAFNEVIGKKGSQHTSFDITFDEIIPVILKYAKLTSEYNSLSKQEIFDKNMLDIEPHYGQAGWKVTFIKAPYYESATDYFEFKIARSNVDPY